MNKARNKINQMSTADWQHYYSLLSSQQLIKHFADEVHRFSRCPMKPDDVLRRFSLNGDGFLDLREFQLAMTRLEIIAPDLQQTDGQPGRDLERARELYLVFCPTQTRKLDIEVFCRIMTEWSLQIMRSSYQHDSTSDVTPRLSSSWTNSHCAPLVTPYATHTTTNIMRPESNGGNCMEESEPLLQRLASSILQHHEKLQQIFFKMDVMSSGKISPEELELAMSHIGVFLTTREYEKLYKSLGENVKEYARDGASNGRWHGRGGNGDAFLIKYADFLALFREKSGVDHRTHSLPSTSTKTSPPVVGVGSARLWDLLVAAFENLQSLFRQYERIGQTVLPPETFRDCLLRCGIVLSNADFAALRVRLLPFSDASSGSISISPLLDALKAADRTTMNLKAPSGSSSVTNVNQIPIRLGRKIVPITAYSPLPSDREPYPAGKSTKERNAEASRTIVKISDDRNREGNLHQPAASTSPRAGTSEANETYLEHQRRRHDPFFSTGKPPPALEARILSKLQQLKQLGQISASSLQSVFPGDRFGYISRGQFRQGLVHLNLSARYADVETLFWTLDTQGHGYIVAQDLYDHLNHFSTQQKSEVSKQAPELSVDCSFKRTRLSRSAQKVLEKMLVELPQVLAKCECLDNNKTGLISTTNLLQAIHELGIMASLPDKQEAIKALCGDQSEQETSDQIPYQMLETRLGALCSSLLSPKKRSQHRSTTSVLLAPFEVQVVDVKSSDTSESNETLWNCPRRRIVQNHPAARSTIEITDEIKSPRNEQMTSGRRHQRSKPVKTAMSRLEQRHHIALMGILQDLLERRSDLKIAFDLHRRADSRGHVSKQDLVEIFLTSRLNLHFSAGALAAQDLVDKLFPSLGPKDSLGFLDVLHRINDLLSLVTNELSAAPTSSIRCMSSSLSTNSFQHPERSTGKRLNNSLDMHSSVLPSTTGSFLKHAARLDEEILVDCMVSIRRKLLQESRLKNLLDSDYALQSAAVLIRHAFKGLAPREMVVPIDNGKFEAICRASDIKHVCFRLGLDLDVHEQQFVISSVDTEESGFVSSIGLLDLFTKVAQDENFTPLSTIHVENEAEANKSRSVAFCDEVHSPHNISSPSIAKC
ncbi:PROTEIN R09H10.6 [Plasmopara halstedii]|uniref:PROTEIN R09H10.6 n=1 Tax=Plasmopara halstedii TaxID=4781 RepID=A0A0P1AAQ4_PLAHL|nr:PROTEIN R09H10.6 [Plasmopara halstedii]CEG37448.1 PROTEIN R09H10.6 [Plasmopara halstedii]|eukprot:XP_024573817.1 PROTEIN R09H10.6 [Plasmopara halstedii]